MVQPANRRLITEATLGGASLEDAIGIDPILVASRTGVRPVGQGELVLNVKDFGAVGDGIADDAPAIQAAINAAAAAGGATVHFPRGIYRLAATVIVKSGVHLVGVPGAVIDMRDVPAAGTWKAAFRALGTLGAGTLLTADAVKGTYQVTITSAAGLAEGDWVRLSSTGQYAYGTNFLRGEIKRIRTIAGTTLTFEQALYDHYPTSAAGTLAKVNAVTDVAAYGLTFRGSNTPGANERGLCLEFVNGFSVTECKFQDIDQYCLFVRSSIRGNVDRNRFRGVFYDGTNGTVFYAIVIANSSQWVTVGHNHGERVRHLITITGASNDPGQPRHITCPANVAQNLQAGAGGRSWAYECHGIGEDILFDGNIADGCYGGFVTRGPGVTWRGGAIRNWYAYALHIHPDIREARDIVIQGATVQDRTVEGGGFATPAAVRAELSGATVVSNVVIDSNVITYDVPGQPAVLVDGPTVTADSLVVKDQVISHPGATVTSVQVKVKGGVTRGNIVNGVVEGDSTADAGRSAAVSTMPRQMVGSTAGAITSGWQLAAWARCGRAGSYSKVRICTGTTAPVLTDCRAGVWDAATGAVLGESPNVSATVNAASTVYEIALTSPVTLDAGQPVYLGLAVIGATPGTYRGVASFSGINNLDPQLARVRTGWTTGPLLTLPANGSSAILWAELLP